METVGEMKIMINVAAVAVDPFANIGCVHDSSLVIRKQNALYRTNDGVSWSRGLLSRETSN